ncbi:C2H2-like zinc finger protein [Melia azedarach]|uniref:C2H2-like zinc finger protein n=1 Tax=Melia azedarach TaxID=155640 RepID=A0ACC1X4G6_MELAZ|nr:C2H2-like zinc finger protein [Melia azedarach]
MLGESSSAESKVTAASGPGRYKCANCSRVFKSSRARGGHQIAHRKAREMRGKAYGPVLAAVLIHHIPSDDEEEGEPAAEAAANLEGTGSSENPPKELIQNKAKAKAKAKANNQSLTTKQKTKAVQSAPKPRAAKTGIHHCRQNKKAVRYQNADHHQEHPQPKPQPELFTKDFLGEREPIYNLTNGAETSVRFSEENPLNSAPRVFGEETDDNLDLELHLCSRNVEKLDLELKLGF